MLDTVFQFVTFLQGNPFSPFIFTFIYTVAVFIYPLILFPIIGGILFGFMGGMICSFIASLLGSIGSFYLARFLGRERVERIFLKNPAKFEKWDMSHRFEFYMLLMVRLIGFPPFVFINYLSGLSKITFKEYFWATFLGILPWLVVLTYFSDVFWDVLQVSGLSGFQQAFIEKSKFIWYGAFIALVLGGGIYFLKRRFLNQKS